MSSLFVRDRPVRPQPSKRRLRLVLAGLLYLALTLVMLSPFLPAFGRAIPGGAIAAVDGWQNVWHLWWVAHALRNGLDPFFTTLLYHPGGVALHLQPLNLSNGLLVAPATLLWGSIAGYNLAVVLAFVLSGLAAYLLIFHLVGDVRLALIGGAIFAFSPFHLTRLWDGQLELLTLQWLAFYVLALLQFLQVPSYPRALLAGALLALTTYTSLYYALAAGLYSLFAVLLWWPLRATYAQWFQRLIGLLLVGVTALLLLVPLLAPVFASPQGAYLTPNPDEVLNRSANLLDFFLPSYLHPLWGAFAWQRGSVWHPLTGDWNVALGYLVLSLAFLGLVMAWRETWRWGALAGFFLLLTLGPVLQAGPWRLNLPLPYLLIEALPGAALGRRPLLFTALITLFLAILAVYGLRWLLSRLAPRMQVPLLVVVVGLLTLEYAPPFWPRLEPVTHPAYAQLNALPGAVMDVPPASFKRVVPQQVQMSHERPILGGYLARMPLVPLVEQIPLIRQFWYMQPDDARLFGDPGEALAIFQAYDVKSVVVRWDLVRPDLRPGVRALLATYLPELAPTYHDDLLSIYTLPDGPRQPFGLYGEGWYPQEREPGRAWRWMEGEASLRLINPLPMVQPVELDLTMASYAEPRDLQLRLADTPAISYTIPAQPREQRVTLHLLLPPGEQHVFLTAPTTVEADSRSQRALSIVLLNPSLRPASRP
ncbi:hypothetical protein EYB53_018760 [Candidatus Chloroploca sp. M-50]|uniref:YfhO family protein n=1 Tax=Candidatus Chloroploca mongolica TaxID=2528176 RepID=A0ABS4DE95_9CHLR|nr:hypothetical protein [Candidatus Chloroploca mongolica]MBP1467764.1 hypothetical protein [Candidatus Chloroploca mongolica]